MRVAVAAAVALLVAVGVLVDVGLTSGAADPATVVRTTYGAGAPLCSVTDARLGGISGMAVTDDQLWVVDDRGAVVYRLDDRCRVAATFDLAPVLKKRGVVLSDVEDLVLGPEGRLWLADVGGNRASRSGVQLVGWVPGTDDVRRVVLDYPSGTYDAEAVLIGSDGRAVVVTKVGFGPATVFATDTPLVDGATIPLVRRGTVDVDPTGAGGTAARLVTGAAVARSGVFVVLRTYAAAWEYDVPDGDIAEALVGGTPRRVALPESRQGEAIAYDTAGTALLATTEGLPAAVDRVPVTRVRVPAS
ncbi:hypothetical protein [Phycicoccus duodecadis]|uniref:Sugar lactone lactonase YvrE n=1 Tax=Phycicoccus duodecadis TaxID=173053 RepID=A0A2N3YIN4_9MICO|nr:hypothetical protein [Phycicoccus duodecadis]PKW26714.1 hypothetical protein ATL31_1532 [Phycicoccus duodecadis]